MLWVLARFVAVVVLLLGDGAAAAARALTVAPLTLAPAALLLTAVFGSVDLVARHERALLGALGVTRRAAVGVIVLAGAGAEGVLYALSRLA